MTNRITHNGKQYEIGKLYYSPTGIGVLKGINISKSFFVLGNNSGDWDAGWIEVIDDGYTAGTISDAPIELEEGCWYMTSHGWPMLWENSQWHNNRVSATADQDFTPIYKMERAK